MVDSGGARIHSEKTKHSQLEASSAYKEGVLIGKVECLLYAPAIEVLALHLDFEANVLKKYERVKSQKEFKVLEVLNSHRFLSYGRYSTFFADREFFGDIIWRKEGSEQYIIVNVPAKHIKAPLSSGVVRGEFICAYRLREVTAGVTRLTVTFSIDSKGSIPSVMNKSVIPACFEGPATYQKYFQLIKPPAQFDKNGKDATLLAHIFMDDIEEQVSDVGRQALLQQYFVRALSLRSIATEFSWIQVLLWRIVQNQPQQTCIPCASQLSCLSLAEASSVGRSFACCLRDSSTPDHAVDVWLATYPAMCQLDTSIPFFRHFITCIAKRLYPKVCNGYVQTKMVSETQFKVTDTLQGSLISQTRVGIKFNLGAGLVSSLEVERALAVTRHLSELRLMFDKSVEVDRWERKRFSEIVKADNEAYETYEKFILAKGMARFTLFEGRRAKSISMPSPFTKGKVAFVKGDRRALGLASGDVRADAIEVAAFFQDTLRRSGQRGDDVEKSVDMISNSHNRLIYNRKKTSAIIHDRDFLARVIWKNVGRDDRDEFHIVTQAEESSKRAPLPGVVRGKFPSAMKVIGAAEPCHCRVEYVIHPDWGGNVPSWVSNGFVKNYLARVTEVQNYFQSLRRLSDFDEKDGAAIGETLMTKSTTVYKEKRKQHENHNRVANVVNKLVGLKEFAVINPWFPSLIEGMLSNWLSDPAVLKTKLDNLSNYEALTIGKSFALALYDRQIADAAVDMFVNEYASLIELKKREQFFVPMAAVIGQRKLDQAIWGMIFKVGAGAILGVLDVGTDINAIVNFTIDRNYGFASAVVAMVSVSMAIQVLIVYGNGRRRGVCHILKEALIVLSGFKPAVDAYRVISGATAHRDDELDPMLELTYSKIAEIVNESIPSALVQFYAILTSSNKANVSSLLSILVSIATISLATTTICVDTDLDPDRRGHTPDFYGYVPNSSGKRTLVCCCMFIFTACHVTVRMIGVALLAAVSPLLTAIVLGGDMIVFFLFKLARDDLRMQPNIPEVLSWVISFVQRISTKLLVDFTALVHCRHPQEEGGVYWILCLIFSQTTSFVAVHLYSADTTIGDAALAKNLWVLMSVLETSFVISFATFLTLIKKKYVRTFFSTMTAKQFRVKSFREATTDQNKMNVFKLHPSYYSSIRNEVEQWVRDNYETWIEERPDWFTERLRRRIPVDMIPESG